jgi:hypothetical protein
MPTSLLDLLDESIAKLRVGVLGRLLKKYIQTFGEAQGKFLCAAILNEALLEDSGSNEAKRYLVRHQDLVKSESLKLHADTELAEGLSYLYAAQTLYLAIATGNPFSERSAELGQQATDLSIYIPNAYDICGTGDANDCILAISRYATNFVKSLSH